MSVTLPTYDRHPLSAAFPLMDDADMDALVADMQANGQRDAGTLYQGMVIDGWHRYQACKILGVAFRAEELAPGQDPRIFVISRNAHRRHLTSSQRALAVAKVMEWIEGAGRPNNSATVAEFLEEYDREEAVSTKKIAEVAGVAPRQIERAKTAIRSGLDVPVQEGRISLDQAERIAKLPDSERAAAIESPPRREPSPRRWTDEDYERLLAEYNEMKDAAQEVQALAESAAAFEANEQFGEMVRLREQLRVTEIARDRLLKENAEMRKQLAYWKKVAEKSERAK